MNAEQKGKVLILGIGGAAANTIRALKAFSLPEWITTALIDTDSSVLHDHPADAILELSSDWMLRKGAGCGGDVMRGQRAMSRERGRVGALLQGFDLILVTAGLGGGTATGGILSVASVLRGLGTPAVFLVTTPFSFEPFSRRKNAEHCLGELAPVTDILLVMQNDLLFSLLPPASPAEQAFSLAAQETARTLTGIASVMRCRNLLGSDYATFMSALREHRCVCGIGIGTVQEHDGADRTAIALERLLSSPFLGGREFLSKADSALVLLSGGTDLTLAELKRSLEHAGAALRPDIHALFGAGIMPGNPDFFQLTVVAIHYTEEMQEKKERSAAPGHAEHASERKKAEGKPFHPDLGLTTFSRGVFEKHPVVRYKDIDLDEPTFQRRNLNIDKGS